MCFSIAQVIAELKRVCAYANVPLDVPVSVNSRLTTTLGRVKCLGAAPSAIEFSKIFLEQATYFEIIQVIRHEAAHYIAIVRSGEFHGHDEYFRAVCAEIGCEYDRAVAPLESVIKREKKAVKRIPTPFKYEVYCPCCGKVVDKKKRMCKMLKEIEWYECPECYCGLDWREL